MPTNQLVDLENRQDKLLIKLDILYERIKKISSLCVLNPYVKQELTTNVVDTVSLATSTIIFFILLQLYKNIGICNKLIIIKNL